MKPGGIEPVESRCTVMGRVETKEERPFVEQAMPPLATELGDENREYELHTPWK